MAQKDLLGLKELSPKQIDRILCLACDMKNHAGRGSERLKILEGRSVLTLFYENSTRTRVSFELAAQYLGATTVNISSGASSVQKGESLIDTIKTLNMMGTSIIVIRHPDSGASHLAAKYTQASVINGGDGMNEHPTQALLDMLTIKERFGSFEGLKVAIIGDILHSRVARSNMWGLGKMGAKVVFAGPHTLLPPGINEFGAEVYTNVEEAIAGAHVIMCLRIQKERQQGGLFPSLGEYTRFFGVDAKKLRLADKDAIVMHPGPVNQGVEVSSDVAESPRSVITKQVQNGIAVRMAVLKLLAGGGI
ncbi:MAG TPA: aspartate carbamoyltransferase catalytic subunit [Clostridia bacterium]|nr:aspartate carbamoyltransferase catalytic subunit [Clostridia bacterium]